MDRPASIGLGMYCTTIRYDDTKLWSLDAHPSRPPPAKPLYVPFLPAAGVTVRLSSLVTVVCSARLGSQRAYHGASDWGPGTCCETTPSLKGDHQNSPDTVHPSTSLLRDKPQTFTETIKSPPERLSGPEPMWNPSSLMHVWMRIIHVCTSIHPYIRPYPVPRMMAIATVHGARGIRGPIMIII
jgi:hypothetical protein